MFGSEVIDVGIGMALLFLFMSLIASALREVIENFVQSRAGDLERGIKELLHQPDRREALISWLYGRPAPAAAAEAHLPGITPKALYEHPLILSLYRGHYSPGDTRLPAYIPRQSFATAILDLVARATETGSPLSIETLRSGLADVQAPNPVQRVVLTALGTAGNDLGKVQHAVEEWYDASMDRVSGWYTKRTSRILAAIGFLAAVCFNVDAIAVGQRLITDKALREAVVKRAEAVVKDGQPPAAPVAAPGDAKGFGEVKHLKEELASIGFPIGWTFIDRTPYPIPQACVATATQAGGAAPAAVMKSTDAPVTVSNVDFECRADYSLLSPLLGWIITGLAVMLGAPFWFDVLNKFMIVRSTIKPKEKSPDEASPDRQKSEDRGGSPAPAVSVAAAPIHDDSGSDAVTLAGALAAATLAVSAGAFKPHEWANAPDPQGGLM